MSKPHETKPDGDRPVEGATGLRRIWNALWHSVDGLRASFRHESAFRQEVALACVLIPAALLVNGSATQKAVLLLAVLLVLITELLNSAVEVTIDRISRERHDLAKRAKDTGSAAVLVSLVACTVVWLLILWDIYG